MDVGGGEDVSRGEDCGGVKDGGRREDARGGEDDSGSGEDGSFRKDAGGEDDCGGGEVAGGEEDGGSGEDGGRRKVAGGEDGGGGEDDGGGEDGGCRKNVRGEDGGHREDVPCGKAIGADVAGRGDQSGRHEEVGDDCDTGAGICDVGDFLTGKVKLDTLTKSEKIKYLKNHRVPSKEKLITQKIKISAEKREKTLTFQISWLERFKWLVYSESVGGGLCKYCVLFPSSNADARISTKGVLVTRPFQNLAKAMGKDGVLQNHEELRYHKDAVEAGTTFIRSAANPTETLPYLVDRKKQNLYDQNFHALRCIVNAVIFCGKQNISLRGHRDDSSSTASNKGNFLAVLDLISEYDEGLKSHLETARHNATATSKTFQNEIIDIIGSYIRKKITKTLSNEDAVFSIIADEVTDKFANQELLSLCLRFVEMKDGKHHIKEAFLDFVHLERTTGKKIASAIKDSLVKHDLDIRKVRGQAYDGASCMSSARVGVQAEIKREAPLALYTHCSSHVLNLSIVAACKLPSIRNMIDVLDAVFLFFHYSPKRQRLLERVLEVFECESKVKKLKGLCKTRWVERHTCFETFMELYKFVVITLEAILDPSSFKEVYAESRAHDSNEAEVDMWSWDRDSRVRAQGMLTSLKSSDQIVAFCIAKNTLHVLKQIASKLQKRRMFMMRLP